MSERFVTFGDELADESGNTVRIVRDNAPMSPREWDNGTEFYTYDGNSPDNVNVWDPYQGKVVQDAKDMIDILCEFIDYDDICANAYDFADEHPDEVDPNEWMFDLTGSGTDTDYIPQLVKYINEHGGWAKPIAIGECDDYRVFDGNDEDGPYEGIIYMTKDGKDAVGCPDGCEFELLDGDITNQNNYMKCNVFGFEVEDDDGECIDNCYGIYPDGDTEWMPVDYFEHHLGRLA